MKQNPSIINYDAGFAIRFVRKSWKVLTWVQDLTKRSMKDTNFVSAAVITFPTREEAETEARTNVIPHLLSAKGVESAEIVGWGDAPETSAGS